MYDKGLVVEILSQIYRASQTILERFKPVYYGRFPCEISFVPYFPNVSAVTVKNEDLPPSCYI